MDNVALFKDGANSQLMLIFNGEQSERGFRTDHDQALKEAKLINAGGFAFRAVVRKLCVGDSYNGRAFFQVQS